MPTKICSACNNKKSLSDFTIVSKVSLRRRNICKRCFADYVAVRRKMGSDLHLKSRKAEQARRRYRELLACDKRGTRKKLTQQARELYYRKRAAVLKLLGGRCKCGCKTAKVLQIDHVLDNGKFDRASAKNPLVRLNRVLRSEGIGYQLLCANCNLAKELSRRPTGTSPASIRNRKIRNDLINLLGGKCKCGCKNRTVLCVDHVFGAGAKERKLLTSGSLYRHILSKVENGSCEYQLLCANCNWLKRSRSVKERGRPLAY